MIKMNHGKLGDGHNHIKSKGLDVQMALRAKVANSLENEFFHVQPEMNISSHVKSHVAHMKSHVSDMTIASDIDKLHGHQLHEQQPVDGRWHQQAGRNISINILEDVDEPKTKTANADVGMKPGGEKKTTWRNFVNIFDLTRVVSASIFARFFLAARKKAESSEPKTGNASRSRIFQIDVPLLICIGLWYLGNFYYNITNKVALNCTGGLAGFPLTIATLQLGVGVIYSLFLWVAPDARPKPSITFKDYISTLPVGLTAAGAHVCAVMALSAGAVSFAQIVKAAEPAFAALLGALFYGVRMSAAKWLCLIPVIGGVAVASFGELDFAWAALAFAALADFFAALNKNETKKLMGTPGISERLGSVGNQYAISAITAFFFCIPTMLLTEGHKLGLFLQLCSSTPLLLSNIIFSGLWFYLYNELSTQAIKKTGAVTQSVLSALKRVMVIVVLAVVMGESIGLLKLIGCGICIGGVFLYSIIDKLTPCQNRRFA